MNAKNAYLKNVINPFQFPAVQIPDETNIPSVVKTVTTSATLKFPDPVANSISDLLFIENFSSLRREIRVYGFYTPISRYLYYGSLFQEEDLAQYFDYIRPISGGLNINSSTVSGSKFNINGIMNCCLTNTVPNLNTLNFQTLASYAKNNTDKVVAVSVADGVTGVAYPSDFEYGLPTSNYSLEPNILSSTALQATKGAYRLFGVKPADVSSAVAVTASYLVYDSTTDANFNGFYRGMYGTAELDIRGRAFGPSAGPSELFLQVVATFQNGSMSTWTLAENSYNFYTSVYMPGGNIVSTFQMHQDLNLELPLEGLQIFVNAGSAINTVTFGAQGDGLTMKFFEAGNFQDRSNTILIGVSGMDPTATIRIAGVNSYEAIPNDALSRNLNVAARSEHDPVAVEVANTLIDNAPSLGIPLIASTPDFFARRQTKEVKSVVESEQGAVYAAASKGGLLSQLYSFAKPLIGKLAPSVGTLIGSTFGLPNIGYGVGRAVKHLVEDENFLSASRPLEPYMQTPIEYDQLSSPDEDMEDDYVYYFSEPDNFSPQTPTYYLASSAQSFLGKMILPFDGKTSSEEETVEEEINMLSDDEEEEAQEEVEVEEAPPQVVVGSDPYPNHLFYNEFELNRAGTGSKEPGKGKWLASLTDIKNASYDPLAPSRPFIICGNFSDDKYEKMLSTMTGNQASKGSLLGWADFPMVETKTEVTTQDNIGRIVLTDKPVFYITESNKHYVKYEDDGRDSRLQDGSSFMAHFESYKERLKTKRNIQKLYVTVITKKIANIMGESWCFAAYCAAMRFPTIPLYTGCVVPESILTHMKPKIALALDVVNRPLVVQDSQFLKQTNLAKLCMYQAGSETKNTLPYKLFLFDITKELTSQGVLVSAGYASSALDAQDLEVARMITKKVEEAKANNSSGSGAARLLSDDDVAGRFLNALKDDDFIRQYRLDSVADLREWITSGRQKSKVTSAGDKNSPVIFSRKDTVGARVKPMGSTLENLFQKFLVAGTSKMKKKKKPTTTSRLGIKAPTKTKYADEYDL
jgi:hypothetical protein